MRYSIYQSTNASIDFRAAWKRQRRNVREHGAGVDGVQAVDGVRRVEVRIRHFLVCQHQPNCFYLAPSERQARLSIWVTVGQ